MNRKHLQVLAHVRLKEAQTLLKAGFPDGAYYLAGYSVDCALKACIAKSTQRHDFADKDRVDDSYTHNLKRLVIVAKLNFDQIEEAKRDPIFKSNWDVVGQWSEESRYYRNESQAARPLLMLLLIRNTA